MDLKHLVQQEKSEPGLEVFLKEFSEDRLKEYQDLLEATQQGQWDAVHQIFHTWKGVCRPYGYLYLGELSEDILRRLASGERQFQSDFDLIKRYLNEKAAALGE